ncbi:hypothetical protein RvY_13487 [Ramazzottius varieornatus]|uniref:Uncharacterized protein n=1 Tax=Ramazzottius varieornatus TaxID=947166 RepID=A0A1D1VQ82_RAMVA|nr:hypothetical protein RvY_13487 [Ramazzottius varieornatus]
MYFLVVSVLLVGLSCQPAFGVDSNSTIAKPTSTGDSVIVEKIPLPNITVVTPIHESPSIKTALPTTLRAKRQIGYGALGSGLVAGLSGISSGYGYGYNNAVGLQGQGVGQGAGVHASPLGLGFGGGFGGLGFGGYGALPVGYGNIGGLGVAGLNGGFGPVGAVPIGGVIPVGGMGGGLVGQGVGGPGWSAPAVAVAPQVTSAVVPTTGGGAYGRSDEGVPAASSVPLSDTQSQTANSQQPVSQITNVQG